MIVIRVLVKVRIKMRQVARRIGESKCYLCWLPYLFWSERLLAAKASLWSAPLSSQTLLTAESPHPSCFVLMTCWGMHAATKADEFSEKFSIQKLYCKFPFILRIYLIVKLSQNPQTSMYTQMGRTDGWTDIVTGVSEVAPKTASCVMILMNGSFLDGCWEIEISWVGLPPAFEEPVWWWFGLI